MGPDAGGRVAGNNVDDALMLQTPASRERSDEPRAVLQQVVEHHDAQDRACHAAGVDVEVVEPATDLVHGNVQAGRELGSLVGEP
ncbi:MAG: hypothetical protein GY708_05745 [Actinomycetia bacterium]|nr:hypothetical protein [Actinomycetes bacterium]